MKKTTNTESTISTYDLCDYRFHVGQYYLTWINLEIDGEPKSKYKWFKVVKKYANRIVMLGDDGELYDSRKHTENYSESANVDGYLVYSSDIQTLEKIKETIEYARKTGYCIN